MCGSAPAHQPQGQSTASNGGAQPLAGIRVHVTGFEPRPRDELRQILQRLGGTFEGTLDRSKPPHVVVACSTVSEKYQVSRRR